MKTNHRDGTRKRHESGRYHRGFTQALKDDTDTTRRAVERRLLHRLGTGDDAVFPDDRALSDPWSFD